MPLKRGDEYKCAACQETFLAMRSDEEAIEEMAEIFGTTEDRELVCDVCWRKMMGLPPAEEEARA